MIFWKIRLTAYTFCTIGLSILCFCFSLVVFWTWGTTVTCWIADWNAYTWWATAPTIAWELCNNTDTVTWLSQTWTNPEVYTWTCSNWLNNSPTCSATRTIATPSVVQCWIANNTTTWAIPTNNDYCTSPATITWLQTSTVANPNTYAWQCENWWNTSTQCSATRPVSSWWWGTTWWWTTTVLPASWPSCGSFADTGVVIPNANDLTTNAVYLDRFCDTSYSINSITQIERNTTNNTIQRTCQSRTTQDTCAWNIDPWYNITASGSTSTWSNTALSSFCTDERLPLSLTLSDDQKKWTYQCYGDASPFIRTAEWALCSSYLPSKVALESFTSFDNLDTRKKCRFWYSTNVQRVFSNSTRNIERKCIDPSDISNKATCSKQYGTSGVCHYAGSIQLDQDYYILKTSSSEETFYDEPDLMTQVLCGDYSTFVPSSLNTYSTWWFEWFWRRERQCMWNYAGLPKNSNGIPTTTNGDASPNYWAYSSDPTWLLSETCSASKPDPSRPACGKLDTPRDECSMWSNIIDQDTIDNLCVNWETIRIQNFNQNSTTANKTYFNRKCSNKTETISCGEEIKFSNITPYCPVWSVETQCWRTMDDETVLTDYNTILWTWFRYDKLCEYEAQWVDWPVISNNYKAQQLFHRDILVTNTQNNTYTPVLSSSPTRDWSATSIFERIKDTIINDRELLYWSFWYCPDNTNQSNTTSSTSCKALLQEPWRCNHYADEDFIWDMFNSQTQLVSTYGAEKAQKLTDATLCLGSPSKEFVYENGEYTRKCEATNGWIFPDTMCKPYTTEDWACNQITEAQSFASANDITLKCLAWNATAATYNITTNKRERSCQWTTSNNTSDSCEASFLPPTCNQNVNAWWSSYELNNHPGGNTCTSWTPSPVIPYSSGSVNSWKRSCTSTVPWTTPVDCSATVTKPVLPVIYNPENPGAWLYVETDVLATLQWVTPWHITVTNNNSSAAKNFSANSSFIYEYSNFAGLTWTTIAQVTRIDDRLPSATALTCQNGKTNESVSVSLTDFNTSDVSVSYNGPWLVKTAGTAPHFRDMVITVDDNVWWYFTLTNRNGTANLPRSVTCIDRTPPSANIQYSTTRPTAGSVTATLIQPTEPFTVTNNNGSPSYTFTDNGDFRFELKDNAGNTGNVTARVSWIDKTAPNAKCKTSPFTTTTSWAVLVTLEEFSEDGIIITNNSWLNNTVLTWNWAFTFDLKDIAGNEWAVTCNVTNIDNRVLPTIIKEYSQRLCPARYQWQIIDIINNDQYVYIQTMIKNCFMKAYNYKNKTYFFPNKNITVGEFVSLMWRILQFTNKYEGLISDRVSQNYLDARTSWERKEDLSEADTLWLLLYIRVTQENHLTKVDAERAITPREARRLFAQVLEIAGSDPSLASTYIVDYWWEAASLTRGDMAYILSQYLWQYESTVVGNNLDFLKMLQFKTKEFTIPMREKAISQLLWYMRAIPNQTFARVWLDKRILVQDLYRVLTGKESIKLKPQDITTQTLMNDRFIEYIDTRNNEVNNIPEKEREPDEKSAYYDQSF